MKKNILIFITPKRLAVNIPKYYKESFDNLIKQYNVEIIICYKKDNNISIDENKKEELNNQGYSFQEYLGDDELIKFSKKINTSNTNVEVYTYREAYINIMEQVKVSLGQKITPIKDIFISKKLQRENLLKYDKKITVNFLKFNNIKEIDIEKILNNFSFPFIIKPSSGISSAGVMKINSKEELLNGINSLKNTFEEIIKISQIKNYEVVIEEFIDGKMYTIDYFVDQMGKIHKSKIIRTNTLKEEYNIEDFGITKEVLGEEVEKEIKEKELDLYLEKCIMGCGVKNTFIHHEFKITSLGELKTIELNGRIGGYRLEMYKKSYNFDLIELLFNKKIKPKFINNYIFIGLFPKSETDKNLVGLDKKFINNISNLESFYNYMVKKDFVGKKIGFTKNGFKYFGTIRLLNKDFDIIENDYKYIKENLDNNIIYEK